jgi:CheY-like chemotaxis protein
MSSELRVLIVDDHVDCASSLGCLLETMGCKTATAYGGAMGLRMAMLFKPDLVFLDLEMPGANGCEVLAELRGLGAPASQAMVVCLTGTGTARAEEQCVAAGFDEFVRKPISYLTLTRIVERARDRRPQDSPHTAHDGIGEAANLGLV